MTTPPRFIAISEIAEIEGLSPKTVQRRIDAGAIPSAPSAFGRGEREHRRVIRTVYFDLREAAAKGALPHRIGKVRRTGARKD